MDVVSRGYPFTPNARRTRNFSSRQKLGLFFRDGFLDRYSGDRLVNPGLLRALSVLLPDQFPYHPNWKIGVGHGAYWALYPTYDHVVPIARGGEDSLRNVVTTSQLRNSAKSHWTVEELGWQVIPPGDLSDWDGLSKDFVALMEARPALGETAAIREWYRLTRDALGASGA